MTQFSKKERVNFFSLKIVKTRGFAPPRDNCSLLDGHFWALWALLGTFVTLDTFLLQGLFYTMHIASGHSPGIMDKFIGAGGGREGSPPRVARSP